MRRRNRGIRCNIDSPDRLRLDRASVVMARIFWLNARRGCLSRRHDCAFGQPFLIGANKCLIDRTH
jgi:hypothetical protein